MTSDARALPLRDAPAGDPATSRRLERRWAAALAHATYRQWLGALCLLAILAGSLLIVLAAADHSSILSPTANSGFFPDWMAGPLRGTWPGLTRDTTTLRLLFSGVIVGMYAAYLLALVYGTSLSARFVVAAVVAVHGVFLLSPPLPLTDVFNYINYGRMEVVHHLNPYTTIPIFEPHSDPSYALSNWHRMLSPYGPLFTVLTFALVPLGVAASFWVLKVVLAAASLATLALVWRCARLLGRDPVAAIVLVGLNPVVLVWGLGGDHNDSLMLLLVVLGFYLLLRSERGAAPADQRRGWLRPLSSATIAAGSAFVAAAAIKASAAVLIPVVLAGLLHSRRRLAQVGLGMALMVGAVGLTSVIAFGLHIPNLSTQSRLVTAESVPNLIGVALGAGGQTETLRVVFGAVLAATVVICCVYAWRRRDWLTASGWATVALLVTQSWFQPWYVLWVLPLAALSRSRRMRVVCAVLGAYMIIVWAPSTVVWKVIGFHPDKTSLGRQHQRYVTQLSGD